MYKISLTKKAEKVYENANASLINKLNRCFQQLQEDPYRHPSIKRLQGDLAGKWRYRIGNWHVIYTVDEKGKIVIILIISSRGDAYDR